MKKLLLNKRRIQITKVYLFLFGSLLSFHAIAQDFEITPLNEHFFQTLSIEDPNTKYNQLKSFYDDGSSFTQITDFQNRVIKTIQSSINKQKGFLEEVVKVYNLDGDLILRSEENKGNTRKLSFYYEDGVQVGHVIYKGNNDYEIWRKSGENRYKTDRNDFEPSLFPNDKDWKKFLLKELKFLSEAQKKGFEGTVILAFLIDKNGQRVKTEVANLNSLPQLLTDEARRVGELFIGNFNPAINYKGETIEAWLYLPVGFYFYK